MSLLSVGINHQTAPVDIREKIAFSADQMGNALSELQSMQAVNESVIISTCNRTEIYCETSSDPGDEIARWLSGYHGMSGETLSPYLYQHADDEVARHLFRVASGLDSMVLGEPQILGQLKSSFDLAQSGKSIDAILSRLFQHSFNVAKRVRTDTEIGAHPVSVAFTAVSLSKQIFGELGELQALLIGAGETIELVARHLRSQNIGSIVIANRSLERAARLAQEVDAQAVQISDVPEQLENTDIVISSTASQLPILGKGAIESALKKRRHRPIFLVDLAVPRDIESEAGELNDIYLYTIDDLHKVVDKNQRNREMAAEAAQEIINLEVKTFGQWLTTHQASDEIRALRDRADRIRQQCLDRVLTQYRQDQDAEKAMERLANSLTNKMVHGPTMEMRKALMSGDEATIRLLQSLISSD